MEGNFLEMHFLYLIPKNWLSRLTGRLVRAPLPSFIRVWMIQTFARVYQIDLNEAEKPMLEYKTVGDFFTRKLAPQARPLGEEGLVHPADSVVSESGRITQGRLIQAKDQFYSLSGFLGKDATASTYQDGAFATYYLCPTDYHRVHSPVDGYVRRVFHIPGQLWPVNVWSVQNIRDLFVVNERVVVEIESAYGMVAVVFVGATNVGEISLSFWPEFRSNVAHVTAPRERIYSRDIMVSKGDELGIFHMGSTVVMICAKEILNNTPALAANIERLKGRKVRVRSNISMSQPLSPPTLREGAYL